MNKPWKKKEYNHIGINIKGALKKTDKELDGIISTSEGYELNAFSLRTVLQEFADEGYEVFTGCDNIDDKGHCLGHEE